MADPEPVAAPRDQSTGLVADPRPAPEPAEVSEVIDPPAAPKTSFEAALDPVEPSLVLGGLKYECIPKLPARTYTRMVTAINGMAVLKDAKMSDPGTVAQVALAFERIVELVERVVVDDQLEHLNERLDSKTDPVDFPELLQAMMKLMPMYSGASTKKA